MDPLARFHPHIAAWFRERVGVPTPVQAQAWPAIASGAHVLATAPTGSGKTLAALLWAIDRLATGAWEAGTVRVLYLSPLKALNTDISRNLLEPLAGIAERFAAAGEVMPAVRVQVRSGDTPQLERQRMARRPPEILATTPESLALLLSSGSGRRMLAGVRTVILDEIHAVAGGKRGAWLMTSIERLVLLAGEVQRVALSATVRPLEIVAALVGGFAADGAPRAVTVLRAPSDKRYELTVHATPLADPTDDHDSFWPALARELKGILAGNRSTLFFANNRRLSEKLARYLNEGEAEPLAWAHHGSLSRELRGLVEERLKRGELKALVATGSLELGIDVGAIDEVVLIQTPFSVNACIQRLGRAGHQVGAISRGRLYPTHGRDLLAAAAIAPLALAGTGEAVLPVRAPLDVLAQVVTAMVGVEDWREDELFNAIRRAWSYRELTRSAFDLVLAMLAGGFARADGSGEARIRELTPRLRREDGMLSALPGTLPVVYSSGGMIPDRGYFALRVQGSGAKLGELDEEFVWERHSGDDIAIGAQTWRIAAITNETVEVVPSPRNAGMPPFWRADSEDAGGVLAEATAELLAEADRGLDDPAWRAGLEQRHRFTPEAARRLLAWLERQREATGALPHARRVIAERCPDPAESGGDPPLVLHAPWGRRLLRPWAIALTVAWREAHGVDLAIIATEDALLVPVPAGVAARAVVELVRPERLDALLRAGLERTGFFGARFRENAGRALLLPRGDPRRRTPLWQTRLKAKKLMQAVARFPDFPILAETWRTCLEDAFDLPQLRDRLDALQSGVIELREVATDAPSPFAEGLVWSATNQLMYASDAPLAQGASSLSERVLAQVLRSSELRPRVDPRLAAALQAKLQRVAPGYAPANADELVDLVRDRVLLPLDEWRELLAACARDHQLDPAELERAAGARLRPLTLPGGEAALATATQARRVVAALADPDALRQCLAEWLRAYTAIAAPRIAALWGLAQERIDALLEELAEDGDVLVDQLLADDERVLVCDAENLERLLRLARAARRQTIEPIPVAELPWFLARWQGLAARDGGGRDALQRALDHLFGWVAPAAAWESDLLPARIPDYLPPALDTLLATTDLRWFGHGAKRLGFAFNEEVPLHAPGAGAGADALLPGRDGRWDFHALLARAGGDSQALADRLWSLAWRGEIANDGFAVVRQGIANDFTAAPLGDGHRAAIAGWRSSRPMLGAWYALPGHETGDAVTQSERDRERARRVLDRYGIVFRELLAHEPAELQWSRLQPALRLLELSGEAVAGLFVDGVPGLQFATPAAIGALARDRDLDAVWWCVAIDPASGCGIALDALKGQLPPRLPSTHLIWHRDRLALISRRHGDDLEIRLAVDDPALARCLACLGDLVQRPSEPLRKLAVETINGEAEAGSHYRAALLAAGFAAEYKALVLRRRF